VKLENGHTVLAHYLREDAKILYPHPAR
jgi:hypothetical protein